MAVLFSSHARKTALAKPNLAFLNTMIHSMSSNNQKPKPSFATPTSSRKQRLREVVESLAEFDRKDIRVESETYYFLIKACTDTKALDLGRSVHSHMINSGVNIRLKFALKLISMYIRCGSMDDAQELFDKMPNPDSSLYKEMIEGYARQGQEEMIIEIHERMRAEGFEADRGLLCRILKIFSKCDSPKSGDVGRRILEEVRRRKLEQDSVLCNALMDMYGSIGKPEKVRKLFDQLRDRDMNSWTSMILGYARKNLAQETFHLLRLMSEEGFRPNSLILTSVLPLCNKKPKFGMEVHCLAVKGTVQSDVFFESALVRMYAKSGNIDIARQVFEKMTERDIVCWNTMISCCAQLGKHREALELLRRMREEGLEPNSASWNSLVGGLAQNGDANKALKLFQDMQQSGLRPNFISLTSALPACAQLTALEQGKEIHGHIFRRGFDGDSFLSSALVSMYGKCGVIEDAEQVFKKISAKDTVAWNSMIVAYAMHGHADRAFLLFEEMQKSGFQPNAVTFSGVLSACSHVGFVKEGMKYFRSMPQDHGIMPDADHYAVVVDLLARAGRIKEAYQFIEEMPIEPSASAWGALLAGCRVHLEVGLAEIAAEHLFALEPENVSNYVVLSNLYAALGMWEDASKVRKRMDEKELIITPGCTWTEADNKIHTFGANICSHPQAEQIHSLLENLTGKIKELGYKPSSEFVLPDVEDGKEEKFLCSHSQKLAIAFGLLNTVPGKPIRVITNLRTCGDCHDAIKLISHVTGRLIMVRDSCRSHHFRNGYCLCGDHW